MINRRKLVTLVSGSILLSALPSKSMAQITRTPRNSEKDPTVVSLLSTADHLIPEGTAGELEVVLTGGIEDSYVFTTYVLFKNNTNKNQIVKEVHGIGRDVSGTIVGVSGYSEIVPHTVPPGGVGIARVYFDEEQDVNRDSSVEWELVVDNDDDNYTNLEITEISPTSNGFIGVITNQTKTEITSTPSVLGVWLDDSGNIVGGFSGYAQKEHLAVGEVTGFDATGDLFTPTANYIIGAVGFTL